MRHAAKKTQKLGQDGRPLCLVCSAPVGRGRTSYCGNECWHRNTPQVMRRLVGDRDKGICAGCQIQCRHGWELLERIGREEYRKLPPWECDHIVPVIEGGGLCGIEGYRTLCRTCHKAATAALAKRRAERRKPIAPSLFAIGGAT